MRYALIFVAAVIPAVSRAQDRPCSALKSVVTIGPLSGHRIDSVQVETASPGIKRTPGFSLTLFPCLESSRHREKRRLF